MPEKLYLYVDESGQDTKGAFFVVVVVVADADLERWRKVCENVERDSEKGRVKWQDSDYRRRLNYIRLALCTPLFAGRVVFASYREGREYDAFTAKTIALAIQRISGDSKKVILIDGLPKEQYHHYGALIRQHGVKDWRVRGIRREERDALIRLADAFCGFIRDACYDQQPPIKRLFDQAIRDGIVVDLGN